MYVFLPALFLGAVPVCVRVPAAASRAGAGIRNTEEHCAFVTGAGAGTCWGARYLSHQGCGLGLGTEHQPSEGCCTG